MQRPAPNEDLLRRALAVRERDETDMQRYLREEHEAAIGGARVSMDALRRLWPIERNHLSQSSGVFDQDVGDKVSRAHGLVEDAYALLDEISERFHGEIVERALLGKDITADLERAEERLKIGPKYPPPASADQTGHRDDSSSV